MIAYAIGNAVGPLMWKAQYQPRQVFANWDRLSFFINPQEPCSLGSHVWRICRVGDSRPCLTSDACKGK
jgi:hypothetical protein